MTSTEASPARSAPIGTLLLLAVTGLLYVLLMMKVAEPAPAGPEDSLELALEVFFLTLFLWGALALLLLAGGLIGEMPRRAAILACVAHPLSGLGAFVAIDMVSRHVGWALLFPALLPLLMAFYAMWARFPRLHAVLPAQTTDIAVWSAILILSIAPLIATL